MGQSTTPKALALGVSLSLACGLLPGAAFADEAPEDDASANAADSARGTAGGADSAPSGAAAKPDGYDKADFYSDNPVAPIARTLAVPLAANTQLRSLSNEMKYFARFESNQNYDQGLSWGDGYHAMGYYQFDNRYSLKSFISYCYNFDPVKYRMFSWVPSANISGDLYDGNADRLTDIGQQLNESWHAAYAADPCRTPSHTTTTTSPLKRTSQAAASTSRIAPTASKAFAGAWRTCSARRDGTNSWAVGPTAT